MTHSWDKSLRKRHRVNEWNVETALLNHIRKQPWFRTFISRYVARRNGFAPFNFESINVPVDESVCEEIHPREYVFAVTHGRRRVKDRIAHNYSVDRSVTTYEEICPQ